MSDREKLKKLNRNNYNNIPNVKEEEKKIARSSDIKCTYRYG